MDNSNEGFHQDLETNVSLLNNEIYLQDSCALTGDWKAVSNYLTAAMQEVARDLGGEEFANNVAAMLGSDEILPNPEALKLIEVTYPGSAETVLIRTQEIQKEAHQRELAESSRSSLRKYGRSLLEGLASFNVFGNTSRRHK